MANIFGGTAVQPQTFSDDDVMVASFRLEAVIEAGAPVRKIYLRTYELADAESRIWHATPESEWPLLASITPNGIIMRPIHVNPHAKRYLSPKNGRFTTVIYAEEVGTKLPADANAATRHIERHLPWKLFDSPEYGLGLHKDLDPVWQGLSRIPNATILVVSAHPDRYAHDGVVSVGIDELDKLRRGFNRITLNVHQLIRQSEQDLVQDDVLSRIDPARFQRTGRLTPSLVEVRREGSRQAAWERAERKSDVQVVCKPLDELVIEAPRESILLHAEIKRVTLAKIIETFRTKLAG